MRAATTVLTAIALAGNARGDSIMWNAAHVQAFQDNGILDRAEPKKYIKTKSSKSSSKEKQQKTPKAAKKPKTYKSGKSDYSHTVVKPDNSDNNDNDNVGSTVEGCSDEVLAIAPKVFCNEWIPGIGASKECSSDEVKRGGDVCNLVSMAWLRALYQDYPDLDLVINHAGLCQADILDGAVTHDDVVEFLPKGFSVVLVKMSGQDIKNVLQEGAIAAYDGNPKAYPYGYGLRYSVDYQNRNRAEGYVYNIEVKPGGIGGSTNWKAVENNRIYLVATNSNVASGESGYGRFGTITDKQTLAYTDAELFVKYAQRKCDLEGASYSTVKLDGLDKLLADQYKCLEDDGLCDCGFC